MFNMLKHMFIWTGKFEENRGEQEDRLKEYGDKLVRVKSVKELIQQWIYL